MVASMRMTQRQVNLNSCRNGHWFRVALFCLCLAIIAAGCEDRRLTELRRLGATIQIDDVRTGDIWVYLDGPNVTDEAMVNFDGLDKLRSLRMTETRVTDRGLAYLSRLASLRELVLLDAHITDAGLANLRALTNLERLCLAGAEVTDSGLAHIGDLSALRSLDLTADKGDGCGTRSHRTIGTPR